RVTAIDGAPDDALSADILARAVVSAGGEPDFVLLGATPDGRDAAGRLAATLPAAVLSNATAVDWGDDGPVVVMSVFGGKLVTRSSFTSRPGIVTIRANAVTAEPAPAAGSTDAGTLGPAAGTAV